MTLYLDTSALVKLYTQEPGSLLVKRAVQQAESSAISVLGLTEALAAFARKHREGVLTVHRTYAHPSNEGNC